MKKILFLMLIMAFFSPLINAYELQIYSNNYSGVYLKSIIYLDDNGKLTQRRVNGSDQVSFYSDELYFYWPMSNIKQGVSKYIKYDTYMNYAKSNIVFLDANYRQINTVFLNFLYNDAPFTDSNYIEYDAELLYNEDGYIVESIVNGVWAGLYDDSQKSKSGALYNKNGSLIYYNGEAVTVTTSFLVWLQKFTNKVVIETFEEIQRSLISGIIAAVVLVLAIVRLVLELLPSSITPRRRRYYGGGRGSLPDYGDGSQVAASVRARLAAKNRALKARAYDRSGVEQSTINGIIFDLENDR